MSTSSDWSGVEALPLGKTLLLEASAGTGKTWQIEGLVVRLVAEYEVPIDRILVITFTNAATAELRDRVRSRLVKARDALGQPAAPDDDPILSALWASGDVGAKRRSLLATALSSFDLAPISTIHGFSQRMLDQLAFESGQEPGLELVADPASIIQELVDDDIARVYAEATELELAVLTDMGWSREYLGKLAKAMSKAVEPVVEPVVEPGGSDDGAGVPRPLDCVEAWVQAKDDLQQWLEGGAGVTAVVAVEDELERKKDKRVKGLRRDVIGKHLPALKRWLAGPALRSGRGGGAKPTTWSKNLQVPHLEEHWVAGAEAMRSFEGYALFERVTALFAAQDALWPTAIASFAARARRHIDDELVRTGRLTYSTMLSRLAERIAEEASARGPRVPGVPGGPAGPDGPLTEAIRSRFDVALVDEFQDTDGAQWPVMRAVFSHPERRLLIIGDPKQAIYAFRGADVHVYLDAAEVADERATMRTNWRSDAAYVDAMNHLWAEGSGAFDLTDVDYVKVGAAPNHKKPRIRRLPSRGDRPSRAFELRWLDGDTLQTGTRSVGSKNLGQDAASHLAALEAARLLEEGAEIFTARSADHDASWSPLRPGDIAVLVRTNNQALRVRRHLDRLGVPSVSAGRGTVMDSPVLGWLCAWLDAAADPGRDRPARALATTPLFGWTALDLATAISAADNRSPDNTAAAHRWDDWLRSIQYWAGLWSTRGFVRVFEAALDDFGVVGRLLGGQQGERYATDLRHLVELCHAEERRTRLGPSGLASWLRAARDGAGDGADDAQALRLESDARAVQLVTIHKSKGLEYPVVLLPFAWADYQPSDRGGPLEWHAEKRDGGGSEIRLNLELPGTDSRARAAAQWELETRQEQLRLLYVALTRARHHAVAWLGPLGTSGGDTGSHALGRMALRARDADGTPVADGEFPVFPASSKSQKPEVQEALAARGQAAWAEVEARFELLANTSGGSVGWSVEAAIEDRTQLSLPLGRADAFEARPWPDGRRLVTPWEVSSYSAMVAGRTFDASEPQRLDEVHAVDAEGGLRGPGAEGRGLDAPTGAQVELGEPVAPGAPEDRLDGPIPTAELRGGTDIGTWAHAVFEDLDFRECAARDGRDLETLARDLGARHGVRAAWDHQLLASALPGMLDTPLDGGPTGLASGFSLRTLTDGDRLDELGFDLGLGDGNRWRFQAGTPAGLLNEAGARVALESRLGDAHWGGEEWLRAVLERPVLPEIAGILTGFIDLTFRVEVAGSSLAAGEQLRKRHRYFVCDYKTNRIAPPNQRQNSRRLHYTRPWMAWEMAHHGYHL
ncbi:MAG: UvrD-helicase domain-containing protein, partial [Deltaproteobacteria bacterium]|nr:UvrD-helicase domain-containing protein [Deltaproteobacteria bacterium]